MLLPNKRTAVWLLFGSSWPVAVGPLSGASLEKLTPGRTASRQL